MLQPKKTNSKNTDEFGVNPTKRKLFDESSMSSNGFADVGFNTSSKNFGLSGGVGFNPEDLYGRVGGSFNRKGLNTSANFTQRPEGKYSLDTDLGYSDENIDTSLGYSRTDTGEQFTGNINAGSDKLRLIMDYLKNTEGENFNTNLLHQDVVKGLSGETLGTLATSFGAGFNQGEPSMSGGLDFTTKAYQDGEGFKFNAKGSYSEEQGPSINAGVKYRFGNGTNSQGIMKKSMNPRKKYANGSNGAGIGASNYIESPQETLNDYNIMMAKASQQAMSNPWLPVVSIVGTLAQQAVGQLGGKLGKKGDTTGDINASTEGDFVETAMGNNNVQNNIEVEGGEMYETPQGQVGEFQGASHEQGGIPLEVGEDVEEGTKVYSDRLKVGNKTLAERKATRERQIANLEKIASNNLADQAVKNAAKRKMMAIEKEEAADLDFQDKVSNIQKMTDTMVEAFACGTGMKGIQKYPDGTGPQGIVYGKGYDESMFKDFFAKYNELNPGGVMDMKYIQGDLGIPSTTGGFGKVFGPGTYKASQDWLAANKDKTPDPYVMGDVNEDGVKDTLGNNPNIDLEALKNFKIGTTKKEPSKFMKTLEGNMPAVGDVTKLIGNYLGMTAGIKTAAEQRSTDVTHTNVFANAGKESQKLLDNAKQGIETSKAQAIVKATDVGRGGKRGARGSARGVNQMRSMDWLYDTALQEQIAQISANAAQQISGIDIQKSGVAMNADQLKGAGEWQATMANDADKDAYYTALGLGRKDFATGLQQSGKDINSMKENNIIENLMKNYGSYFSVDESGNLVGKATASSKKKEEEVFLGPDGKTKFKLGKNNQLIQVA